MTVDMQAAFPFDPPPPPAEEAGAVYGAWSADPSWGPPAWPGAATSATRRRGGGRRILVAGLAVVCIGAGGGVTTWALAGASHPAASHRSVASQRPSAVPSGSGSSSAAGSGSPSGIDAIDAALVDINATLAGGNGEVAGTGMIITASGEVLTNNHVIEGTRQITVQVDGAGPVYTATVIGDDPADDIALLQIHGVSGLTTIAVGDSSALTVGEQITAIGNALGRGGTPASAPGVVSALDQVVTAGDQSDSSQTETLSGMIQVSALIEPGDSGGAIVNAAGQVVGMTTAGSQSGGFGQDRAATTGFAIPIAKAMTVIREIRSGGGTGIHIGYGALLGVDISPGGTAGATVAGVVAGTPAAGAGIAAGDTIISVGGHSVSSSGELRTAMQQLSAGQSVTVTWLDASGGQHSAQVTLASGPPA